jgi:hypothetical protein
MKPAPGWARQISLITEPPRWRGWGRGVAETEREIKEAEKEEDQ